MVSPTILIFLTALLAVCSPASAIRYIIAEQRVESSSEGFLSSEHTTSMLDERGQPWSTIDSTASKSSMAVIPASTSSGRDSLVSIVKRTVSQWMYKGEELIGFRTSDSYEMQQIASKAVATSDAILESLVRSSSQGAAEPDFEYQVLAASDNVYDPASLAQQQAAKQDAGISFEIAAIGAGSAADSNSENFYVEEEDAYTESYDDKFIAALEDLDMQMVLFDGQMRSAELAEESESATERGEDGNQHDDQHRERVEGGQRQEQSRDASSSLLQVKSVSSEGGKKAASSNWFGLW